MSNFLLDLLRNGLYYELGFKFVVFYPHKKLVNAASSY